MVPRAAVGVILSGQHVGERHVGTGASSERRRLVDRRAHERVPECDRAVRRVDEAGGLCRLERPRVETELPCGCPDHGQRRRAVRGSEQQQLLRAGRQAVHAGGERLLRPAGAGAVAHELEQRQRVAGRPRDDVVAACGVDVAPVARAQQLARGLLRESLDAQLWHAGKRIRTCGVVADREQQHDALRVQTASREAERETGLAVEPRSIVQEHEDRLLLGGVGEQRERARADQEAVGLTLVGQTERAAHRARLRVGQMLDPLFERAQELVQRRVRQLGLGLDAGRTQDLEAIGARRRGGEQRGLADARLAAQQQRAAAALARGVEQPVEGRDLALAPDQHHAAPTSSCAASPLETSRIRSARAPMSSFWNTLRK